MRRVGLGPIVWQGLWLGVVLGTACSESADDGAAMAGGTSSVGGATNGGATSGGSKASSGGKASGGNAGTGGSRATGGDGSKGGSAGGTGLPTSGESGAGGEANGGASVGGGQDGGAGVGAEGGAPLATGGDAGAGTTSGGSGNPGGTGAGGGDSGGGAQGEGGCAAQDECGCYEMQCRTLSTGCYCPFPQCDDSGACACGGGTYLGCEPPTCPAPNCSSASVVEGPDSDGCYACADPPDCEAARDTLEERCGFGMGDLSCAGDPECVLACLVDVTACDDIGCRFCSACDCGLAPNELVECYQACSL